MDANRFCGLDMSTPRIMGILNVTPDSFSDGGQNFDLSAAVTHAKSMVAEGADIIDIGGESTRPGADFVPAGEEIRRTIPVIKAIRDAGLMTPISIDTRKAEVARAAIAAGADIFNDVSALTFDPDSLQTAADLGVHICLMHAVGDPKTMQREANYRDVVQEVYDYLADRISVCEQAGISSDKIMIDLGIGFAKTQEHNLLLLQNISKFHGLECPILLGVSRKRFIGTIGNEPDPQRRTAGSIAVGLAAINQGVQILRVHDIKETKQAIALWQAVQKNS